MEALDPARTLRELKELRTLAASGAQLVGLTQIIE